MKELPSRLGDHAFFSKGKHELPREFPICLMLQDVLIAKAGMLLEAAVVSTKRSSATTAMRRIPALCLSHARPGQISSRLALGKQKGGRSKLKGNQAEHREQPQKQLQTQKTKAT